jgi:hypothetical protein
MNKSRLGIKVAALAGAALFLSLAGTPAQAQVRGGSYLRTCTDVRGAGDSIFAACRREDGSWRRTALRDADSCRGDISNQNGHLACNRGGRAYGWEHRRFEGYGSSYRAYPRGRDYYHYGR